MTKDELIKAIRESPLTPEDFQEILAALIETMMGQAFVGLGMDIASGQPAMHWERDPYCKVALDEHGSVGVRINPDSGYHEHLVER